MPFLGLALSFLTGGVSRLFGWLTKLPWQVLALFAAGLLLALAYADARHWQKVADRQKATIAAFVEAQKAATDAQVAVNHEPARKSAEIAKESNHDALDYYAKGRAAGLAYAAAHRVQRNGACAAGGAGVPGTDRAAPVDDRPGDTPDMVAVPRANYDVLVTNTLRLAQVHQDAMKMIAAGVAVPSVTEPEGVLK